MSESSQPTISYDNWADFLFQLGAVCTPAEFQGMVCGALVACQRYEQSEWIEVASKFMDLAEKEVAPEKTAGLVALYDLTLSALSDDSYNLKLLLPEDALPLVKRIEALGEWCQGFLHGLGAGGEGLASKLDSEGQDALRDIAQIAHVDLDEDESEENEVHYTELVEYVRMATINLFAELNPLPKKAENTPSPSSLH